MRNIQEKTPKSQQTRRLCQASWDQKLDKQRELNPRTPLNSRPSVRSEDNTMSRHSRPYSLVTYHTFIEEHIKFHKNVSDYESTMLTWARSKVNYTRC